MKVFIRNSHPRSFVCSDSAAKPPKEHDRETEDTVHFPCVADVCKWTSSVRNDFTSERCSEQID